MISVLADHGKHLSTPLKYIETPRPRSKLSQLSSGQLRSPLGPSLLHYLWYHSRSHRGPVKGRILSYLTLTLYLSLLYCGPPTHLPLAHFLVHHHSFPIGQPSPLGLLCNQLSFRARLTHCPDDGGSTHL
jgi:hypothetical protein